MLVERKELSARDEQKERELTHAALEDVGVGRVVDHQSVLSWLEGLSASQYLPLPNPSR